jgi:DNA polymerase family A
VKETFTETWVVDFEYSASAGEHVRPICFVALELQSKREIRVFEEDLLRMRMPPYPLGPESLFVAYAANAEFSAHLALGWQLPARVLDLYVEFRNLTNGMELLAGSGLLGAASYFRLGHMAKGEKTAMRDLAIRGGPWTNVERQSLLDYCAEDVYLTAELFAKMRPGIDNERALFRGRYMAAVARMEFVGIPIDTGTWNRIISHWDEIKLALIEQVDAGYHVYEDDHFRSKRFAAYLHEHEILWPLLPSGALSLEDDTFRAQAQLHPELEPLRQLRTTLGQMRLRTLAIGKDGRNRTALHPFCSRTGRNQPSNAEFIFGPAVWMRHLIKPEPRRALAYVDWEQQEFGIAAALSKDQAMLAAYESGDPYLAFAKQAGAIPNDGTKESHPQVRDQFKACTLAVQYGMGAAGLASRIQRSELEARNLLRLHRETYRTFWRWIEARIAHADLHGWLQTMFGWKVRTRARNQSRFAMNFPMQGNGAEMLRAACCYLTEAGIQVDAPVHDALLIEADLADIDQVVLDAEECMARASRVVLDGFELRTEAQVVRWPDRFKVEKGKAMWDRVSQLADRVVAPAELWQVVGNV